MMLNNFFGEVLAGLSLRKLRTLLTIAFMVATITVKAQSFDEIIAANRYIACPDVTFNAVPIIRKLYTNGQIDSVYQFIDYWERKCGFMESTFRLRNILDIRTGQFEPGEISHQWIELLLSYRQGLESNLFHRQPRYFNDGVHYDFISQKAAFDTLTRLIAFETLSTDEDESLLLDFYSTPSPTFQKIKSASGQSMLKQLYQDVYSSTLLTPQFHIAFVTGIVQNYGNISTFGTRPTIGMVMGGKQLRHNYDIILDFRAGPSKEEYSFTYGDTLVTHRKWTGMYVGLEYTFDFFRSKNLEIGISPGIAYDRITALTVENDLGEDAKFLSSFNTNAGLVFKYTFSRNGGYAGLHVRYNLTDYKNPGGTKLDGQYINIRFTIGSIGDLWRSNRLRRLE